jgi:hypothetical protein
LKDFIVSGEESEDVPRREGNVKEESHLTLQVLLIRLLPYCVSCGHQMIIVNPYQWWWCVWFHLFIRFSQGLKRLLSEDSVCLHICLQK